MSEQFDFLSKVVIIGDSAVGKTNLLMRYTCDEYKMSHIPTIGVDFKSKIIKVDDSYIKLQLWDTAGQQRFRTITQTYFNGAAGIAIVYAISDRKSFQSVQEWIEQLHQHCDETVPKIILGNKCDLSGSQRVVQPQEGRLLADKYKCPFMEVSAKANIGVNESFLLLAKSIKKQIDYEINNPGSVKINGTSNKNKKKGKLVSTDELNKKKGCC